MNEISRYFAILGAQLHAVQCGRGGWSRGRVGPYVSSSMGLSSVTLASRIPSLAIKPWMVSILRLNSAACQACLLAFFFLKGLLDKLLKCESNSWNTVTVQIPAVVLPELRMFLVRQPRPVLELDVLPQRPVDVHIVQVGQRAAVDHVRCKHQVSVSSLVPLTVSSPGHCTD